MDNKLLFQKMIDLYTENVKFIIKDVYWSNEVIIILVWGKDTSSRRTNAIDRLGGYIHTLTSQPVKILMDEVEYLKWVAHIRNVKFKKTYDYDVILSKNKGKRPKNSSK